MEGVTLITPTGDRHLAFVLCQKWMKNQTLQPDQWIVIDDGKKPLKPTVQMDYVRREPQSNDPKYTLIENLKVAVPRIKYNKIIIIEDDEYYAPKYVETIAGKLNTHEIVGIGNSKYYHLPSGGNFMIGNGRHASLAQTAFRRSFLPEFKELLKISNDFLDMQLWKRVKGSGRGFIFFDGIIPLYVGIKGLPGRPGIGVGHNPDSKFYRQFSRDTSRKILKQWIYNKDDYNTYMNIINEKLTKELAIKIKNVTGLC